MNAIAGVIYFDDQPTAAQDLTIMAARLPDFGVQTAKTWDGGSAALYRQLTAVTPEDHYEKQPIVGPDSGLVLSGIFRLDNRAELFRALDIPSPLRGKMPDGELVLKAYERWQSGCLQKLLGDFSFAIWDPHKKVLTLATDFSGSQNIFFHKTEKRLVFATSAEALFAMKDILRELDEGALLARITLLKGLKGGKRSSYYKNIEGVLGGSFYEIKAHKIRRTRYWDPSNIAPVHYAKDQDYYEAFETMFINSVDVRLRQNRNIGLLLSGGLDSAAVAAVAAKLLKDRGQTLHTYTYRPINSFSGTLVERRIADEWPYVEMIAAQHDNIDHHFVQVDDRHPLSQSKTFLPATESPLFVNASWLSAIGEIAQDHNVGAMLHGGSGNFGISYSSAPPVRTVGAGARGMALLLSTIKTRQLKPIFRILQNRVIGTNGANKSYMQFLTQQALMDFFPNLRDDNAPKMKIGDANVLPEKWRGRSENLISNTYNRFFRAFNMTTPDPCDDRRIIEFCIGTPQHIFTQNGQDRLLVRRGLKDHIPEAILTRKDRGAQSCDAQIYLGQYKGEFEQLINSIERSNPIAEHIDIPHLTSELDILSGNDAPFNYSRMLGCWSVLASLDFAQWMEAK